MTDRSRPTALTDAHRRAGAKLGGFAGWEMPLRFAGTLAEHAAVREHVGVFDVSHLGTVWIEGDDAQAVVAATLTNDPAVLGDGASQYTLCCTDDGGIVDDLIAYRLDAARWLVVPNAANTAAVVDALVAAASDRDAAVHDQSGERAILAVQGPAALPLVDRILRDQGAATAASDVAHLGVVDVEVAGGRVLVCRTGYTGEPGCELVLPNVLADRWWTALVDAGAVACGLAARDTLRLEMGYPLHGNELSEDHDPFEARLAWAVKLDRGAFRGSEALARRKAAGPVRRLWGLRVDGRRPVRAGMSVHSAGSVVGTLTSGTLSPTLGVPIALCYLDVALSPGDRVDVDLRGTSVGAEVVRPPFVDRDPRGTPSAPARAHP